MSDEMLSCLIRRFFRDYEDPAERTPRCDGYWAFPVQYTRDIVGDMVFRDYEDALGTSGCLALSERLIDAVEGERWAGGTAVWVLSDFFASDPEPPVGF